MGLGLREKLLWASGSLLATLLDHVIIDQFGPTHPRPPSSLGLKDIKKRFLLLSKKKL